MTDEISVQRLSGGSLLKFFATIFALSAALWILASFLRIRR
jgi:hypothetical protein